MQWFSILFLSLLFVYGNICPVLAVDKVNKPVTVENSESFINDEKGLSDNDWELIGESDGFAVSDMNGDTEQRLNLDNLYAEAPIPNFYFGAQDKGSNSTPRQRDGFDFKLMIMYKLVEELKLDEKTATTFFPVYLAYTNDRDNLMRERSELSRKISQDADNDSVSIRNLKTTVEKLKKNEKSTDDLRETFLKKASSILDERQYIKLIVFNDRLKEDLMARFRPGMRNEESHKEFDKTREQQEKQMKSFQEYRKKAEEAEKRKK